MSNSISALKSVSQGGALCILIAGVAVLGSGFLPIGGVAIAIILGGLVGNTTTLHSRFTPGITFCEKSILSIAIALMGVNLDFQILEEVGVKSILLVVTALAVTLTAALLLGKILKVRPRFALLLGIGNGVCGSSAIAATEGIICSTEEEVGLSIGIVNALGTLGIFLVPALGSVVLHLSDLHTGILVGNTLQAVGQVVAGGFSVSQPAGELATIVKMTRILMLFPLVLTLLFAFKGRSTERKRQQKKPGVPLFIIGFILCSCLPSLNLLPGAQLHTLSKISHYALVVAMAGIGLKITLASIARNGKSALLLGALIFLVQLTFSSAVILLFF